jgi:hypothetical protein
LTSGQAASRIAGIYINPMRNLIFSLACALLCTTVTFLTPSTAVAAGQDNNCYELRVYYANPGKLDDLHARFRDHTVKLFDKHGMKSVGYWVPIDNTNNTLIYMLSYPSREARETSWKAFIADPAWKAAKAASEKNGSLVSKVESTFMETTDFSPIVGMSSEGGGKVKKEGKTADRVFELRTYTATPNNLANLNARFREHTVRLFIKHGMTNIGYWNLMKDQKGADETLVYILAHKSQDAAKAGFKEFGKDPEWTAARKESEEKGGGPLTIKGGVKSVFMVPTDYSPMR